MGSSLEYRTGIRKNEKKTKKHPVEKERVHNANKNISLAQYEELRSESLEAFAKRHMMSQSFGLFLQNGIPGLLESFSARRVFKSKEIKQERMNGNIFRTQLAILLTNMTLHLLTEGNIL